MSSQSVLAFLLPAYMKRICDLYFLISVRNSNSVQLHHISIEGEQFVIYRWQQLLLTERHTKKYMSNACAFSFAWRILPRKTGPLDCLVSKVKDIQIPNSFNERNTGSNNTRVSSLPGFFDHIV